MHAFIFKSFWSELFLSFSILLLLLFNSKIINNFKFKFPILEHEIFVQSVIILFCVFLLLLNNTLLGFDSNFFFACDFTSTTARIILLLFCILFFSSIWRSFIIQKLNFFEYFIIFLLAVLGLLFLINSFNLLSLYLCLELQAISFYVLASFQRNSIFSSEAGLKYFISSSLISGIFLLGCSCFFFTFGTFNLHSISLLNVLSFYENSVINFSSVTLGILCLFLVFFFKLVIAPFHFWFPQIYDGSPLSSLIIFSTLPKIILFTLFLRFVSTISFLAKLSQTLLFLIGSYSIFFGIFKALKQKRLKKLYIYSSISQMGLPLCALSDNSLEAFNIVFFYLLIYLLTSVLMWCIFVIIYENYSKTSLSKSSTLPLFISSLKQLLFYNSSLALAL
jgi:NADH-quinone oxidoreductase subunit N